VPCQVPVIYIDHLEPDFVPASRAFGSGIHAAAAYFFRGVAQGELPLVGQESPLPPPSVARATRDRGPTLRHGYPSSVPARA